MIVIPMAGLSKRFADAGYGWPKYMLPLRGQSVFDWAVGSFHAYFNDLRFLFIARDVAGTGRFIERSCNALGIRSASIVMLDEPTAGQAETVEWGLIRARVDSMEPITIFNIDTFRPGFRFPTAAWWRQSDGYLEVFRGSGANWSYVRPSPNEDHRALETAEKKQISDLCCTGLYHFARADSFLTALAREREQPTAAELYVAPLYNHLIADGQHIHFEVIDTSHVVFCGVPAEYEALETNKSLGAGTGAKLISPGAVADQSLLGRSPNAHGRGP
jgi:hypothetical protein